MLVGGRDGFSASTLVVEIQSGTGVGSGIV